VASFLRALVLKAIFALGLATASGTAAASAAPADLGDVTICGNSSAGAREGCSVAPVWTANSQDGIIWLTARVRLDASANQPMGVFIKAFAASAVYWDGQLIGRNGRPGSSAALEVPGFRDSVIAISSDLSRPGVHRLQIELSTMRSPLRLASPVLGVRVAPFEEPLQPALRNYLPALLTAGGMLIIILCLAFLGWKQRRLTSLSWLIGAALFATAQLTAESSRAFVRLLYPAQIVRLELVLLCSCGFQLLIAAYLTQRFGVERRKWILAAQAAMILSAVLLLRGLDEKIAWAILSTTALCVMLCGVAIRRRRSGAIALAATFGACLFLGLWVPATFLDRDFYIWALVLFALLLVQEAQGIAEAEAPGGASRAEPASLWLGSGQKRHLVPASRIVRLAAADDYTEVFVAGAPAVLHPEPLHKLLERLPPSFVRVHRSHAVNLAHLESFRRGPGSSVTLSDQSVAPVSRRCLPKLVAAISA
jgi:LytTr DNA-binding domain